MMSKKEEKKNCGLHSLMTQAGGVRLPAESTLILNVFMHFDDYQA
jgi:hypothetical protein